MGDGFNQEIVGLYRGYENCVKNRKKRKKKAKFAKKMKKLNKQGKK